MAANEPLDRDPCELWAGAFGWFDPAAPDGVGVTNPELYAALCPGHKPFTQSKTVFCDRLKKADSPGLLATTLCGADLCNDLKNAYCRTRPSDQSAWVQDYAIGHQCADPGAWQASCPHEATRSL